MVFQQLLIAAPNLDTGEESPAWEWLQAGGRVSCSAEASRLRLTWSGEREILHGVALNPSILLVCVCVCHVPLAPCQAPRRQALDTHSERSARQDRRSTLQRWWDDAGGWQKAGNKA